MVKVIPGRIAKCRRKEERLQTQRKKKGTAADFPGEMTQQRNECLQYAVMEQKGKEWNFTQKAALIRGENIELYEMTKTRNKIGRIKYEVHKSAI